MFGSDEIGTLLGVIAYCLGNYEQADAYAQEALALARQIGHRVQMCRLLTNLGGFAVGQGDYTQAERYLQEGIELARQFGHLDLPLMLMNLGKAIGQGGDYNRAVKPASPRCVKISPKPVAWARTV